jgi:PKD domain
VGSVFTSINPAGGGTTAWLAVAGGLPVVAVREDYAHGAFQVAQLAGEVPGPVGGLSLSGSSQGDALLGFTQGPVGRAEVVGAFIQAPPAPFTMNAPSSWVRSSSVPLTWEASPDALAGVTYTVYIDGRPRLRGLSVLAARLKTTGLGDGAHRVQVLATDAGGQQTMTPAHELKLDANPPTVKLSPIDHWRGVRVNVRDRYSGVDAHATRVSFGDGSRQSGHVAASHRYGRSGSYWITASVRDKVGNRATVRLRVRVR